MTADLNALVNSTAMSNMMVVNSSVSTPLNKSEVAKIEEHDRIVKKTIEMAKEA